MVLSKRQMARRPRQPKPSSGRGNDLPSRWGESYGDVIVQLVHPLRAHGAMIPTSRRAIVVRADFAK